MVEVEVEQDDLNYIATDFMEKRLDHQRVELLINIRKIKGNVKGNYAIHNL